jgi:hypothetical protein
MPKEKVKTLTEPRRYQQTVSHKWRASSIYFMMSTLQWMERLPYFGQQRQILPLTAWLISRLWIKPIPPTRVFILRPHESCGEGLIAMMDLTLLFTLPCHSTLSISLVLGQQIKTRQRNACGPSWCYSLGGLVIWSALSREIRVRNQPDIVQAIPHDRPFSKPQQSQSSPALAFAYKVPENNHCANQTVLSVGMCHYHVKSLNPASYWLPQSCGKLEITPNGFSQIKYGFALSSHEDGQTPYPGSQVKTQ